MEKMFRVIFSLFFLTFRDGVSLELKGGAYEDLVIGITDSVPLEHCRTIIENLEATLTGSSQYLFSALDGRAYMRSVIVQIPDSWPEYCVRKTIFPGSGDTTDITILPEDSTRGRVWTQQSAGCGKSGDQIYLGYETLKRRDDTLGRSLVKEFAKYRYGVFDEQGFHNDQIYPICFYDDHEKRNKVTGCSDLPIKDNGICSNPGVEYNTTKLVDEKARSSIMFSPETLSVSMFCDEGTHDRYAPTKQNLICDRRSTLDVILSHSDFASNSLDGQRASGEITNTTPQITYVRQNITRYIIVIESTKDMTQRESWLYLRAAIRKWVSFDLPDNSEVGVLLANETGPSKVLNILSLRHSKARDLISSNIPYTSGDSSQPACLHCAIKEALSMLNDQNMLKSPARSVVILVAPGMTYNSQLANLVKEAKRMKTRIVTLNYPDVLRAQPLDLLATQTNGASFTVTETKYNVDISMLSTYFQLTNVMYNIIERFYSGSPLDLPMEIHRRKLTDDGRTSITGSFVLDDNVGEPARFMLYAHNPDFPLVKGLSLMSPSHQEYTIRSDKMSSGKIITLVANISEPGTWTYTIERYTGNPQPHYIQVMATPRSPVVPIVRARFWMHKNQDDGPWILFAEVKRGDAPVLGAKVEAVFTRSEMNGSVAYTDTLELLDSGNGDPDLTKGDGIYTRYFSAAAGGPGTYSFEVTVTDNGNTAYTWLDTLDSTEEKPCCGSTVPTSSVQPLQPFQRVLPPITILISSEDILKASQTAVGKIGDLRVQIKPEDMKALLTWTSPDMGGQRVSRYQIKYATTIKDIVNNYETVALPWEYVSPHALSPGSETTITLDMSKQRHLLDAAVYFAVRAFPQMYSDAQAAPISNWVRVLVPSPPPPPTVPPTYSPHENTQWPHHNFVGIDPVGPRVAKPATIGLEVLLPVIIGAIVLVLILILYCYFCVIKKRSELGDKKAHAQHANDKLSATVTIVPSTPSVRGNAQTHEQNYGGGEPDPHTVGVPIANYTYEDEQKKRYSLVQQQEQQLIEELKQQQREMNGNPYVISGNSLQRSMGPYWSASQLLHEHERRHSPMDSAIGEHPLLGIDHMSLNGQGVADHYGAPPVPPLPAYASSNGYHPNYNIYSQQGHPIYQTMQRTDQQNYNTSLQGSLSSVNSGEKKRRNVTMV